MKKKSFFLFLAILCFWGWQPSKSWGAIEEEGQDILFVVDASYSMTTNDPQRHIYDAIQTLGLLSAESNNRIGYVLYNDSIVRDQNLTKIDNTEMINQWLNDFRSIKPVKGTDVGLGLKTGQRILEVSKARNNHTMVILLSDGDSETDTTNPNRSQSAVDQDIQEVIQMLGCPLYVIQYSEVELRNKEPMNQWPAVTGGKSYSARNSQELSDAVMAIYSEQNKMSAEKDSLESERTNKTYHLQIPVPEKPQKRVKELIVTLQSTSGIRDLVYEEDAEMTVKKAGNQVVVKIENPSKKSYSLSYKTESGEPVETTTLTKMADLPKKKKEPNVVLILAGICGILLGVIFVIMLLWKKKKTEEPIDKNAAYFFADSLEGCFIKTPNDEEIPIQNWPASIFQRQKTVTLYDLLWEENIKDEMPESKKVQFQIGRENTLRLRIKGSVEGIQQGREIPKGVWTTLCVQRGAYLIFKEDELELDIHIRKKRV